MILITSAAYVRSDLRAEFGEIPPAFLPIGNRPIVSHQIAHLKDAFPGEPITLSLPEGYRLSESNRRFLEANRVEVVYVPVELSLSKSVLYTLNACSTVFDHVRLHHGDTLIQNLPDTLDCIGISRSKLDLGWQPATLKECGAEEGRIWCGFFSFSNPRLLIRSLATADNDFVDAISKYSSTINLPEVEVGGWSDAGHLLTYLQTKKQITTERAFNELEITDGYVRKTGTPREKILAEAKWFELLPVPLRKYSPCLYDANAESDEDVWYTLEYLPMPALNELFVHGNQSPEFWGGVHSCLDQWFGDSRKAVPGVISERALKHREWLIRDKTMARVDKFVRETGMRIDRPVIFNGMQLPSWSDMLNRTIRDALDAEVHPGLLHGDLCFSNILWDSRNLRVRLIDPRGAGREQKGPEAADITYDLAKLAHSAVGFYDLVISNSYSLNYSYSDCQFEFQIHATDRQRAVAKQFLLSPLGEDVSSIRNAIPQTILLFFSMLPLHDDDPTRQAALLSNGFRLYNDFYLD